MKCRVYDDRGRERWLPEGAIVPAGWYKDGRPPELLTEEARVVAVYDDGGAFDEAPPVRTLTVKTVSEIAGGK